MSATVTNALTCIYGSTWANLSGELDEAHCHKNLGFPTRIPGINSRGSQRAKDLELKLAWLRERNPSHVATLATATPVANSVSELYVMQRYLQPDLLTATGVERFDAWAANFGTTTTALELAPDGGSYRMNTRFARFRNVPELLTMFRAVADVRTAADLQLEVPELVGGRPETVAVPASEELREFVAGLVERAEKVRNRTVSQEEDNMLAITGDGRRAALDLRLVGRPGTDGSKIGAVADRVAEIYHQHSRDTYTDPDTNAASGREGSLQLVFCDLGTPKPGQWSVYRELRDQLTGKGVPDDRVRFVHDARDDRAKAELFAACRDGRIAVLIGSTEKMGVGTNVQRRAVALHHVDCPWRPADLEQREGRIIRQGNQNKEVRILRYVTEGSFDTFMYQTVERKSAFIHQITHGHPDGRQVTDVGDQALSYAEVKALATGNPLIMEKAGVDAEVAKLSRLQEAHRQDQARLARTQRQATERVAELQTRIDRYDNAIDRRVDTRGERFTMTVDQQCFDDRGAAGQSLRDLLGRLTHETDSAYKRGDRAPIERTVGGLAGFDLVARAAPGMPGATVELAGAEIRVEYTPTDLKVGDNVAAITRLERKLRGLEDTRDHARTELGHARSQGEKAAARIGAPFAETARLRHVLGRQAEINDQLTPEPDADPDHGATTPRDEPRHEPPAPVRRHRF